GARVPVPRRRRGGVPRVRAHRRFRRTGGGGRPGCGHRRHSLRRLRRPAVGAAVDRRQGSGNGRSDANPGRTSHRVLSIASLFDRRPARAREGPRMTRMTAIGVVMAVVPLAACSRTRAVAETRTERPTVSVVKIARGDISQTLTLAAEFRPFQEVEVHAKVAGYVKTINVDVGDRVSAGQLLAVLEIPELQDDMVTAEAGVKHSQEEVNRAQADLARTESAHDVAHLSSTRLAAVMKQRPNLVAQQDIDEAQGRDRVAEAQVATAKAAIAAAQEQLAVARAGQNHTKTMFA